MTTRADPHTTGLANPFDDRPGRTRTKVGVIYLLLAAANVAAWVWAWGAFAGRPALLGMALLAYTFGLRHAFDADHIAAIDNVVRKLTQDGRQPLSAGLFFALGHSTIVVLASVVIAAAASAAQDRLALLRGFGGAVGAAVSAGFLLILGFTNLVVFGDIWRAFLRARRGETPAGHAPSAHVPGPGLLARLFNPLFKAMSASWQMYPVGFLFGLGFDTATEIGVLGLSASQAAAGLPPGSILVFPALFTAGMTLMDTSDSVLMTGAFGWAVANPARKLWYNLTITGASVVVAVCIGGLEALGLVGERLNLRGGFWDAVAAAGGSLTSLGYIVVVVFLASWIVSVIVYRAGGFHRPAPPIFRPPR
jgi:high-affinity nickel-transport protein